LLQLVVRLLKPHGWPELSAGQHWRSEIVGFQTNAARRFTPSMRQRIDLPDIHERALRRIEPLRYGGHPAVNPPSACPVRLDQLLNSPSSDLEAAFASHRNG